MKKGITKRKRTVKKKARSPIVVRKSGIHGKGVYATRDMNRRSRIIEYTGRRITWDEANRAQPHDPKNPHHTFYFGLQNGKDVIDANQGGNASRWINHSCDPNCETDEHKGRVYVYALRNLKRGEELLYDYALESGERRTKKLEKQFACYCGSPDCRGTMLEAK
jgi:uncharacterized protein